jgi:hypothetical protein
MPTPIALTLALIFCSVLYARPAAACGDAGKPMCVEWTGKPLLSKAKRAYCKSGNQIVAGLCAACGAENHPACLVGSDGPKCRTGELKVDKGFCVKSTLGEAVVAVVDPYFDKFTNSAIVSRITNVCQPVKGKLNKCASGYYFNWCLNACIQSMHRPGHNDKPLDLTFYVTSDVHFGRDTSFSAYDHARHVWEMNRFTQTGARWPAGTASSGQPVAEPAFVTIAGDLTLWGHTAELDGYKKYYEGNPSDPGTLRFPLFTGLGNHDTDNAFYNRDLQVLPYFRARYAGSPDVSDFDAPSLNYSWDYGDVHFVQTNRFAGDVQYGNKSSLEWLAHDLASSVGDSGRPVVIIAHYGFDSFSLQPNWWTDAQRTALWNVLQHYNIVAFISGHDHAAGLRKWPTSGPKQMDNFSSSTGGQYGIGGFLVVRVTDASLDVAYAEWKDPTEWAQDAQGNWKVVQQRDTKFPPANAAQYPAAAFRSDVLFTKKLAAWKKK